jgi:23S rRNA pseudouridine2605 synthase
VQGQRSGLGGGGGGGGRRRQRNKAGGQGGRQGAAGGERQPDPMRTSQGYIGADAFHNKLRGAGGGRRGGGRKR